MFFGSAIREIGVADLLDALAEFGPKPRAQAADTRIVAAEEPSLTALVFKIQANMDPNHRDRIAFARVCSGRLVRGMRLKQVRTGKARFRSMRRNFSLPATAPWRRRHSPAMWSASRTTAPCASATR